jgi:hypothetical protein
MFAHYRNQSELYDVAIGTCTRLRQAARIGWQGAQARDAAL